MEIISRSSVMCMNFTITGKEIWKNSWQFIITLQIFENKTQKLKMDKIVPNFLNESNESVY